MNWSVVKGSPGHQTAVSGLTIVAACVGSGTGSGFLIGKIVNPIVMALLFFSTITPVGFLMRLFGKDPLRLRRDPAAASYWIEREPSGPPHRDNAQPVLTRRHGLCA